MIRGGGDGGEDMPVPMPNTEAKLSRGDNSPSGEGSALPLFLFMGKNNIYNRLINQSVFL